MLTLFRNLRFSLRQLRKSPGFTLTAVLTLALGIGATTAIYTVVYATLIAPMDYPKPDELVIVWSTIQGNRNSVSAGDFLDWKQQSKSFQDLNAFFRSRFNLGGIEEPETVFAGVSTPGFYNALGVHFMLGHDFLPEQGVDGKDHVVILTNRIWKRLGADPKILGKTVKLDQKPYTVVGVLAPGLPDRYPWELAVPLAIKPEQVNHDAHWLVIEGRLKDGVTLEQANAEMAAVAAHIAQANPRSNKGWGVRIEPLKNDWLGDNVKLMLWMLLGASGFVLLIACANIANLLLAKGTSRQKEIAVRTAVGATRRAVFVQFFVESLLLAMLGGAMGVGVGYALVRGFVAALPYNTLPGEADIRLSVPVLLVTIAATTFAGLLFGCAPAWYASRVDPAEFLKEGGRSGFSRLRNKLRQLLVVGEFALALTLLGGAGMAIHSFWNLNHVDLGVQTDHVLGFGVAMNKDVVYTPDQMIAYYQQIVRSIESTQGVESVSASTGYPLDGPGLGTQVSIAGQPDLADPSQRPGAGFSMVTPGYLKTFGIHLVQGRSFTEDDNAASLHVAVVNEEFVRLYLRGKNPIGQILNVEQFVPGVPKRGPVQPWVIVGVFHDVRGGAFQQRQFPEIDVPFYQSPWNFAAFGVRTAGDPEAMMKTIAAAVHSVDPTAALEHEETLEKLREDDLTGERFNLTLYISFAAIALALAVVGIYGVMAFSVGQREHEIGVRMALGANRDRVVRMILREGTILALIGSLIGLGGAYAVGRALHTILYGVAAFDLTAFTAVAALLLVAALVASYLPARRAASIEPMQALRTE